jgi:hypothetical protein
MKKGILLKGIILLTVVGMVHAQQVADLEYKPPIAQPAYEAGKGPCVAIDEAHHNFHTAEGRYKPFAELLRRDGYRVDGLNRLFSANSLKDIDVLVIANALNERNIEEWSLPTPSAFMKDEISAIRSWIEKGGSVFLIVDHMPFPGAAGDLAKALGVEFSNGFAVLKSAGTPTTFAFTPGSGLAESTITQGRGGQEIVTTVVTFTGSAFRPPRGAIPVLVFNEDYILLMPDTAWRFTAATPRESLEGWCQGAIMKIEKGRVAVFGEAAMFSAQSAGPTKLKSGMNTPGAEQNHQLLLNVMHWLTRVKGMRD